MHWFVAAPTAGKSNTTAPSDANGDGLPDAWQIQYFGSVSAPEAAPGADPDNDGFTNLQEYLAGTDPTNHDSLLKIDSVQASQSPVVIQFKATAGKTYTILSNPGLESAWTRVASVPAQPVTGTVSVTDPNVSSGTERFYRLVTPALP